MCILLILQAFNNTTDHPSVPVVTTVVDAGVGSSETYSNVATMVSSAVVSQAMGPILARLDQQQQQLLILHQRQQQQQQLRSFIKFHLKFLPLFSFQKSTGSIRINNNHNHWRLVVCQTLEQQQLQQRSAVPAIPAAMLERIRRGEFINFGNLLNF